jgi:hypothetical protein
MGGYTKTNLRTDVENQAPKFGMPEYLAFGAGDDPRDAELVPGWWSD